MTASVPKWLCFDLPSGLILLRPLHSAPTIERTMIPRSWLMHVTLLLVCSATAWAMDLMPYAGPQAPLAKEDTEKRHALWHAQLVDAYLKHGDHDPKFDADMKLVLAASAADFVGKQAPADELFPIAERLAGPGGSTDPMAAFAWFVFARHRGGQTVLMACNNAMAAYQAEVRDHQDKPRYAFAPYACLMNFCLTTHDVAQHPDQLASATQVGDQLRGLLIMAINAHEYDPAPTSLIRTVDQISVQNTDMAEAFITDLGAALEESKTEPWLKHTVLASLGIKAAWAWRGSGWASTVTEQGWAGFKRHLEATEKHLTEAYRLNPNHPAIGKMGITLAGAGYETIPMEEWFRRSITACFDDPDIQHLSPIPYTTLGRHLYRPARPGLRCRRYQALRHGRAVANHHHYFVPRGRCEVDAA